MNTQKKNKKKKPHNRDVLGGYPPSDPSVILQSISVLTKLRRTAYLSCGSAVVADSIIVSLSLKSDWSTMIRGPNTEL